MSEWSKFLSENKGKAMEMASAFGKDLLDGLTRTAAAFGDIATAIADIVGAVKSVWDAFGPLAPALLDARNRLYKQGSDAYGNLIEWGSGPRLARMRAAQSAHGTFIGGPVNQALTKGVTGAPWLTMADMMGGDLLNQARDASKTKLSVDARGARITIYQQIETDDPARIAAPALSAAFSEVVRRPLSGRVGLANGGR